MNNNISNKDKKDWEKFILSKEKLVNKDISKPNKVLSKIRKIDLHGYSIDAANKAVEEFIIKSYKNAVNKLIVVTGKGIHSTSYKDPYISKDLSILKNSVPEFIKKNKDLMKLIYNIQDAQVEDGGSGAFYIFLKKDKSIK
ncbi:MAG: Smr/MutS family protein [Alphaproteobacteria bacterium]|nr:Smr/MutS family protein [Alphaproteobacteria bacterium]